MGSTDQMNARKYSVAEIDRMRAALRRADPIFYVDNDEGQAKLRAHQMLIEARLQTYIQGGVEPSELEKLTDQ